MLRSSVSTSKSLSRAGMRVVRQQQRTLATTSRRHAEIQLTVDGIPVSIEQGSSIIQACEKAGATVPRFCYHDRLNIAGNCRMCLVEVAPGPPKPQASCAMPAMPGQKITTNSPKIHKAREGVMEFILANHPLDCPICDQGGECDLQDQSMRYGADRGRFHEIAGKRATEHKDFGPLVKTEMTRCIQCTRCVRFANEVAGVQDLGTSGRGNTMQIGTYVEKALDSEMSGNIIDLCPVGALTSKPYAFEARPWELKKTESIDVLDAIGSNIRIDSRGLTVMRIQPRLNDQVNEEWINDKTRFAYDGLKTQRLTVPMVRQGDRFVPVSWQDALGAVKEGLAASGAKANEIQAIAGDLADVESLVALKDFINRLGSDNTTLDRAVGGASGTPVHGIDFRNSYTFNSTLEGAEQADRVLLIGTNPRHEAAILNTRLRKIWLHGTADLGLIGADFDSTFEYEHIGTDLKAVKDFFAGKATSTFAKEFASAKKPLIIVGSGISEHADGPAVYAEIAAYLEKNASRFLTPEWNGFSVLQRAASHTGAFDVGFVPSAAAAKATPKFVYLLNADDFDVSRIPANAFVVYQGHHGDLGAQYADVILPGVAYTEKANTYVNTEGRAQLTRTAVSSPEAARDDWKIVRALSEVVLGAEGALPYDTPGQIQNRLWEVAPNVCVPDTVADVQTTDLTTALAALKLAAAAPASGPFSKYLTPSGSPFTKPIANFYRTDPISRASVTMTKCTKAFVNRETDSTAESISASA